MKVDHKVKVGNLNTLMLKTVTVGRTEHELYFDSSIYIQWWENLWTSSSRILNKWHLTLTCVLKIPLHVLTYFNTRHFQYATNRNYLWSIHIPLEKRRVASHQRLYKTTPTAPCRLFDLAREFIWRRLEMPITTHCWPAHNSIINHRDLVR